MPGKKDIMDHRTVTVGTVGAGYAARLHGSGYARVSGDVGVTTACLTEHEHRHISARPEEGRRVEL